MYGLDKNKITKELREFKGTHKKAVFEKLNFTIILVQPETAGNVGSIARIMKNFGFNRLVIFNPIVAKEEIFNYQTQGYAMHGKSILLNAELISLKDDEDHHSDLQKYLTQYDLVIGTTAKGKHYSNINRLSIFPDDLEIPIPKKTMNICILFGKESRGLTNEEVGFSDILLRIPTDTEYPTLNLSHACGIILYELFKKTHNITKGRGKSPVLLARKDDKVMLYEFIEKIIQILKIRNYKEKRAFNAFKNVFERSFMSKKELSLILGVFSKTHSILKNLNLFED
ncbi:MAG: TrmJ/YjtD family RNA methyltransferase [Candidatus Lokiarchaeota archaeon]|nr:TrmJ/YjtD family RNA methyltransferase [Candidatus Lokiarchaeota archaeon]MBD3201194.1 TrmJ/YjtD family RNA methyltransferase [Candidatus Lokiarchaeota archaeon]